jgi:hypothetical protein
MKVTAGKLLTSEDMALRVPKFTHMVGQTFTQLKGKSNKKQALYGIPQFLLAFGLDASSPKPLDYFGNVVDKRTIKNDPNMTRLLNILLELALVISTGKRWALGGVLAMVLLANKLLHKRHGLPKDHYFVTNME